MARPAYSLDGLLWQLNQLAPHRSRASDGWIGDPAHQARVSDHNPDKNGIVRARDYTHDPAGGLDCEKLAAALVASKDDRIKYIIWNKRIWQGSWKKYTGANPHTQHLHLSVVANANADDKRIWDLGALTRKGLFMYLSEKEEREILVAVRDIKNRLFGVFPQRYQAKNPDGSIRQVGPGEKGAVPSTGLDTLDGNWIVGLLAALDKDGDATKKALDELSRKLDTKE